MPLRYFTNEGSGSDIDEVLIDRREVPRYKAVGLKFQFRPVHHRKKRQPAIVWSDPKQYLLRSSAQFREGK